MPFKQSTILPKIQHNRNLINFPAVYRYIQFMLSDNVCESVLKSPFSRINHRSSLT